MVKHILGQAIFQSIVILVILFGGATFIREDFCGSININGQEISQHGAECGAFFEKI